MGCSTRKYIQDKLVSGQNIKTINGNSILGGGDIVVSGGGGASIIQIEIDFGNTPVYSNEFTIIDATATATSKIVATLAYDAPTGKNLDELEMDSLDIKCGQSSIGSFKMIITSIDGSYLHDKFKINYILT